MTKTKTARPDIYSRITDQIVAELEKGVRPWVKPWHADHAAGRITRATTRRRSRPGTPPRMAYDCVSCMRGASLSRARDGALRLRAQEREVETREELERVEKSREEDERDATDAIDCAR